jgi:hypothetical protein
MSTTPAIGSKPIQSTYLPANAQAGGKAAGAQTATASGAIPAQLRVVEPVAPTADTVSLSKQSLAPRADLGKGTLDLAQQFISNFARKLFGDAAKGADVSFESATLSTSASFAAGASETSGADGTVRSATLNASESASFIGKGTITTSDGQSFDFEIEVRYEANVQAQATQTVERPTLSAPDALALTGKQLPAIEFPGSLDDLFKLLGRDLQLSVPNGQGNDDGQNGNLSLRLLRLVNSAALLAPRAQPDDVRAPAAERNRALARSYVDKPPQTDIAEA